MVWAGSFEWSRIPSDGIVTTRSGTVVASRSGTARVVIDVTLVGPPVMRRSATSVAVVLAKTRRRLSLGRRGRG